jgi:hypothetical protein
MTTTSPVQVKITTAQKTKLTALLTQQLGGAEQVKKYGNHLPYALGVSYRLVGQDWDGDIQGGEGSLAHAVRCLVGWLRDGLDIEEIVLDVNEYERRTGKRKFYDLVDQVGISGVDIKQALVA